MKRQHLRDPQPGLAGSIAAVQCCCCRTTCTADRLLLARRACILRQYYQYSYSYLARSTYLVQQYENAKNIKYPLDYYRTKYEHILRIIHETQTRTCRLHASSQSHAYIYIEQHTHARPTANSHTRQSEQPLRFVHDELRIKGGQTLTLPTSTSCGS